MTTITTLNMTDLSDYLRSPEGIHKLFARLGYIVADPEPLDHDDVELDEADAPYVQQVYLMTDMDLGHTVWLYQVSDTTVVRLRGLAHNALERAGTHLLLVTKDFREVTFVHPYYAGGTSKSHVRVNKLKVITSDPTRHDVDTINALHAHRRTAAEIYKAQDDAFNVTRITRKFYDEYRSHFERVVAAVVAHNKGIPEFQNSDQRHKLHAYVQRLMGRLMFLYFLQRKGWLGAQQDFLTKRYHDTHKRHSGELNQGDTSYYYREVLDPLFFDTLNQKREGNWTQWKGLQIPYLNGGLFDRSRDPDGMIILPDSLFDPLDNTGLLAFFNRYNFTIADDTPLEQDVAVDPEMLGKVFENMLEEAERGQSGSFYTPRTIVSYMCQEALAGYIEESANIPRDETRQHFDPDALINFTPEQAQRVNTALDTLTVLDPAVGSGSFLIGMMQEILTLRRKAAAALDTHVTPTVLAEWKEQIIRDTLYGVDIKPEAIEIAQLRLWLALVVNQPLSDARPLPNLDYKLMTGNSLIETIDGEPVLGDAAAEMLQQDAKPLQPKLFAVDGAGVGEERKKLEDLRKAFFNATPALRKQLSVDIQHQERRIITASLNEKIDLLQQKLNALTKKQQAAGGKWGKKDGDTYARLLAQQARLESIKNDIGHPEKALPFFLYRLHFNDVFAKKGGFDIVVANPPYVQGDLLGSYKDELKLSYQDVYSGRSDLYVYFFALGYTLLRAGGQLTYITSNKYLRAKYGEKVRLFLSKSTKIATLIDFGDLPIFDAAAYPCIFIAEKAVFVTNQIRAMAVSDISTIDNINKALLETGNTFEQERLSNQEWQIVEPSTYRVLRKLQENSTSLGEYVDHEIFMGVLTGRNEIFVIDQETRDSLIAKDASLVSIIKPWLRGRDIKRWKIQHDGLYILFIKHNFDFNQSTVLKEYLTQFKDELSSRATAKAGNHAWYELQQPQMGIYPKYEKPKIIYPHFNSEVNFTWDDGEYYGNDRTYVIANPSFYLLGVLNSNVCQFFMKNIAPSVRGGYLEFRVTYVEQIPIPDAPEALRQHIATVAQQCLAAAQGNPDTLAALEAQLNRLVYQAYGLDEADIRVIEGSAES